MASLGSIACRLQWLLSCLVLSASGRRFAEADGGAENAFGQFARFADIGLHRLPHSNLLAPSSLLSKNSTGRERDVLWKKHSPNHQDDDCEWYEPLADARAGELAFFILAVVSCFASVGTCCFALGGRMKPRAPRYWKTWPANPWSDKYWAEVDVTDKLRVPVQRLFDWTTKPELMGRGKDGEWATHKGLRVLKVKRIESGRLWSKYARTRESILRVGKALQLMQPEWRKRAERALKLVDEAHADRITDKAVDSFLKCLGLQEDRNERILFHGSPREGAVNAQGEVLFPSKDCSPAYAILHGGFDDRLGSAKGMYGAGTYFADMASKADQYAGRYNEPGNPKGSVGEKAVMFLSRVTLGCPYLTNHSLEQLRRPPCIDGHFDMHLFWNEDVQFGKPWREKGLPLRICDHHRFDSVVGDFVVDDKRRLYREYVVYDMQCYPEFIVEYERTH